MKGIPLFCRVALAASLWSACAAAPVEAQVREFATPLVIRHARVVQAEGEAIENATIVIDRGRIVAVGTDAAVPSDAETFDAEGLIVYPGFIDACTYRGVPARDAGADELERLADRIPDVTQGPQSATVEALRRKARPELRAWEVYDPKSAGHDDARRAGFTAALVSPPAAILSGRSALVSLGDAPLRRSILRTEVALHASFMSRGERDGFSFAYPSTPMGAMAAFRQIMHDARWQRDVQTWWLRNPAGERPPVDRALDSLLDPLDGRMPIAFLANTENEIHRALDLAAEFSFEPVIVGAREGWKAAERLKTQNVPVLLSLNWPEEPKLPRKKVETKKEATTAPAQPDPRADRRPIFDEDWQSQAFEPRRAYDERLRLWHEQVDNARALHAAGVKFALTTFELKSPKEFSERLALAIERGLPEQAALAALTREAAGILGMSDEMGQVAAGHLANLTLCDKPLSDKKSRARYVVVEGRLFDFGEDKGDEKNRRGRNNRGGEPAESKEGEADEPPATKPAVEAVATAPAATRPAPDSAEDAATQPAATQPATTQPASTQPADQVAWPDFASEIEADRKPRFSTGGTVLLRNATLLTVTQGDRAEADLLVEEGRITAIGGRLNAPPGVPVIDLTGFFVTPGLIDAHSHICVDGSVNEGTLSVVPEVRIRDVINHEDVSAFRALAGGVTAIHTMHGSANTIGGQNATIRLKYGRPAAEWHFPGAPRTVKFALGENVKQSNSRTGGGTRFPNSRSGVEAVLRRTFDEVLRYRAEWSTYESQKKAGGDPRPPRRDIRLEALSEIHQGDIWVHCHCYRADEVLRLLAVAEDYGFRIAVLQHILEGYRIIPEIFRHGCSASTFSDWWAYKIEAYDAIPHNAARMCQGGIVATVNSDSAEVIRHMNLEAAKSMRFGGLSPNDALKLVTLNAAIQLGVDDQVGSLDVGKRADLAVFSGHPLDTLSTCMLTFIDGELYFQHEDFDIFTPPAPKSGKSFAAPREPLPIPVTHEQSYWISGATIHTVSGATIENGEVGIAAGRLAHVGPAGSGTPPEGATRIDAAGLHAWPGLINGGVALGLIEIESVRGTIDASDIATLQPDLSSLSAYNPFASAINVSRSEGVLLSAIPAGGGVVQGRAGIVRLDGWSMPEAMVEMDAALFVALPSLPTELPPRMSEEQAAEFRKNAAKNMEEVEAFFRRARHYAAVQATAEHQRDAAVEFDRRLDAMIPYVRGEKPVFFRAGGYKAIREALAFAGRYGLRAVIFGGTEAWKLADELREKKVDVVVVRSMAYPAGRFEPWDSVYRNAAALHRAGVRFCFATDEPSLAKQLGIEAGMAAAHGLDAAQAVRAITLDAAAILGIDDRYGSIDAGKSATLFLSTDNPLQASNCVVAAFIEGRPVDLSNKHTLDDAKFRGRPAPALPPEKPLRGPPKMSMETSTWPVSP